MRILFLSDNFPPEVNAPANRTFEHCVEWAKQGQEITVITCAPNFPEGKLMAGYKNKLFQSETQQGIKIIRVWSYITANKGMLKRTLDYVSFAISSTIAALFCKTDVIIATSPQFFTACAGYMLSVLKRKPWIFEVRDLWPESIRAVGAMKNDSIFKILEWLELFLYKKATKIVVVTDTFKERLIARGIEAKKIIVIKNGVRLEQFSPRQKDSQLIKELGLEGKQVLLYAGTLGMAHAIDFILTSAKKLEDSGNFHFVVMGTGAEAEKIEKLYHELKPSNFTLLKPVAREEMTRYLSIADYALVNLKKSDTFKSVLPSKIFEAAAMNLPIILGVEGEAQELIESYNAGLCFKPEDFLSLQDVLVRLEDIELKTVLIAGCKKLAADFDRKSLAQKMLLEFDF
jgi:glycosyltransferase involved in cell wall biosynthesis